MFRLARVLARLARATSRRVGRTGGTTAPGRLLLKASPRALQRMSRELEAGSVLVSATNGKTTTAAMLAAGLERAGRSVVHNRAGSNMSWGVATALLDAGRERGQLELLADRWAELVGELDGRARFVLNADDPLVADLGRERSGVTYFGVEDDSQALPGMQHAADSKHCRNCGHAYEYEAVYLGHMGRYRCANCGRARPEPAVAATRVELAGMDGSRITLSTPSGEIDLRLPLPGLYNVYNAVAAAATALELGVPLATVGEALEGFGGAFGRVETIPVGGRKLSILLIKNPAGANEVLRTLTLEDGELDLWMALNDKIADGRDVSWIWDADFEVLAGRVRRVTCSGTRAEEMALRLKYAGIDAELDVERDLGDSLDAAVRNAANERVYALPTYTALLDLRDLLADRGLAKRWSE
jgi:UDP-N-acetylmuramyl tripeptide synthase